MTGVYECLICKQEFEAKLEIEETDDTRECPWCFYPGELKYIEKV